MNDDLAIQRSKLASTVGELWGQERATANSALIESASQAIARINALTPDATSQVDDVEPLQVGEMPDV